MRIFRLLGTEIHVNPFFLVVLALFFVAGVLDKGMVAFGIVLLHELSHVIMAKKLGITVEKIELLPFGGVARLGGEIANNPYKEMQIAAAGPACNFFMIFIALVLQNNNIYNSDLMSFFIQCNIIVALFNLLPALPLDGGRVYRAFLVPQKGLSEATRAVAVHGQRWAVFLFILGIIGMYYKATGIDISLTALFVFYAATREKKMVPYIFARHLIRKKDELSENAVLPSKVLVSLDNVPLGKIVKAFVPQNYHFVMIVDTSGEIKGKVTENQIIEKVMEDGLQIPIGELR